jgi:hypothetical protein
MVRDLLLGRLGLLRWKGASYWEDWDFLDGRGLPAEKTGTSWMVRDFLTGKTGTSWMVRDFLLGRLGLLGW